MGSSRTRECARQRGIERNRREEAAGRQVQQQSRGAQWCLCFFAVPARTWALLVGHCEALQVVSVVVRHHEGPVGLADMEWTRGGYGMRERGLLS